MTREIGSEFQEQPLDAGAGLSLPRPGSLVFSGRTAIEAVLRHLPGVRTALLPAYCCDSMTVPFRAAGIEVRFFGVSWENGLKIALDDTADLLLWCDYFGYRNEMPAFDGVIVEDVTHSLLSDVSHHARADYLVASLRKWEPIRCGGYCSVETGGEEPPESFIDLKAAAMRQKAAYLKDPDPARKERFLSMFSESNRWLAQRYSGLLIDPFSRRYLAQADMEKQRRIRRENAKALYEGLKGKVQFLFPEEDMDCPLFVPVFLENRDAIRAHLTKHEIYCPVHWPRPEGCVSNLYDGELSLICDQRYGIEDMDRLISTLTEAL